MMGASKNVYILFIDENSNIKVEYTIDSSGIGINLFKNKYIISGGDAEITNIFNLDKM